MRDDEISLQGLDKAEVLAALYNASRPLGLGALDPRAHSSLSVAEARVLLEQRTHFDYLHGRVMKVRLEGDAFFPGLYDRDNGAGAAARAIAGIKPAGG
jgi:hypothetical protein